MPSFRDSSAQALTSEPEPEPESEPQRGPSAPAGPSRGSDERTQGARTGPYADEEDEDADLPRFSTIGRHLVLSRLGAGGMGVVYEAYDPDLDRRLAVKLLHADLSGSRPGAKEAVKLVREAKALAKLDHPNIVTVYDVGRHAGRVFLAMEFVRGRPLDRWLHAEPPPSLQAVLRVFLDVARGLQDAHEQGMVHRDIKPANILLGDDGRTRLLDFGLAVNSVDIAHLRSTEADSNNRPRRRRDWRAGTPMYMSPEQHLGKRPKAPCDQYAFCASLYEALTGVPPFDVPCLEDYLAAKLERRLNQETRLHGHPRWLRTLVLRGLSVNPEHRHGSMREIVEEIEGRTSSRRHVLRTAVVAVALSGLASLHAIGVSNPSLSECEGRGRAAEVLSEPNRLEAIRRSFEATEERHASDSFARAMRAVRNYGDAWRESVDSACRTAQSSGTGASAHHALRLECLRDQLSDVDALLDTWKQARREHVDAAVRAVPSSTSVDQCDDPEAWLRRRSLPLDPSARARATGLERRLRGVERLVETHRSDRARELAESVLHEASEQGYVSAHARALVTLANLDAFAGHGELARERTLTAFSMAVAASDDNLAAQIAVDQLWVLGYLLQAGDPAELLARARAYTERLSEPAELRIQELNFTGVIWASRRRFAEAEKSLRALVELIDSEYEREDIPQSTYYSNFALVLHQMGRVQESEEFFRRAYALDLAQLGRAHPSRLLTLVNYALLMMARGESERALELVAEARRVGDPSRPNYRLLMRSLHDTESRLYADLGRYDLAIESHRGLHALETETEGGIAGFALVAGARIVRAHLLAGRPERADAWWARLEPLLAEETREAPTERNGLALAHVYEAQLSSSLYRKDLKAARQAVASIGRALRADAFDPSSHAYQPGSFPTVRLRLAEGKCDEARRMIVQFRERAAPRTQVDIQRARERLAAEVERRCGHPERGAAIYEKLAQDARSEPLARRYLAERFAAWRDALRLEAARGRDEDSRETRDLERGLHARLARTDTVDWPQPERRQLREILEQGR